MVQRIKPKRKYTTGAPTTSDLEEGEIAINTADKILYIRDNANTIVEVAGGGSGGGGSTTEVTQTSHGFSVKDCLRHNGSAWAKAKADAATTLALGVVTEVAGANTFTIAQSGRFELTSHGLTVGQWYYLSADTEGALTTAEPSISQPLVYVESANYIFVFPYRPSQILPGATPIGIDVDALAGNGNDVDFTMAADPLHEDNTQVYLDGVYQEKATYSISGTTLTFSTAPANGVSVEVVRYAASAVPIGTPHDNTVTAAKIVDDAITAAKIDDNAVGTAAIADDAITAAKIDDNAAGTAAIADDAITAAKIDDDAVGAAAIADEAIDEARMQISNAGTNGQYLQKQSGDTGGLTWADVSAGLTLDSTVKTASFTAEAGKQYLINTNGGAFTMTLPAGSAGDTIGIIDYQGDFDTNNLTLGQSGSEKIFRADEDGTIDTKNWSTSIKYIDATVGWLPVGD